MLITPPRNGPDEMTFPVRSRSATVSPSRRIAFTGIHWPPRLRSGLRRKALSVPSARRLTLSQKVNASSSATTSPWKQDAPHDASVNGAEERLGYSQRPTTSESTDVPFCEER